MLTNRLEDLRQQHKQLQQRLDDTVSRPGPGNVNACKTVPPRTNTAC